MNYDSISYQDLPEFFEDNMEIWISNFQKLLELEIKELDTEVFFYFMIEFLEKF